MKKEVLRHGLRTLVTIGLMATVCTAAVAGGKSDSAKPIVVYTNSGSDGRLEWLTEQATAAGFTIQVMHLQGGDLANRAIAEKNNPIADMVFGLNPMEYERLIREDMLQKFTPSWKNAIDPSLVDSKGYYYPIVVQPLPIVYNTKVYPTAAAAPKDWVDAAVNPTFKGKYTLLNLGGGTSRTIIVSILSRYLDPKGVHGVSDQGWDIIRQFVQNGHIEIIGEDWFGACVSGERPITELWGSGLLQRISEQNLTHIDFIVPSYGLPYAVEQVAVFKNTKNLDRVTEFINWFGAAELQAKWAQQFGTIPAHPEALKGASPGAQQMMAKSHAQKIDWSVSSKMVDIWMEKIQLEYVK